MTFRQPLTRALTGIIQSDLMRATFRVYYWFLIISRQIIITCNLLNEKQEKKTNAKAIQRKFINSFPPNCNTLSNATYTHNQYFIAMPFFYCTEKEFEMEKKRNTICMRIFKPQIERRKRTHEIKSKPI